MAAFMAIVFASLLRVPSVGFVTPSTATLPFLLVGYHCVWCGFTHCGRGTGMERLDWTLLCAAARHRSGWKLWQQSSIRIGAVQFTAYEPSPTCCVGGRSWRDQGLDSCVWHTITPSNLQLLFLRPEPPGRALVAFFPFQPQIWLFLSAPVWHIYFGTSWWLLRPLLLPAGGTLIMNPSSLLKIHGNRLRANSLIRLWCECWAACLPVIWHVLVAMSWFPS